MDFMAYTGRLALAPCRTQLFNSFLYSHELPVSKSLLQYTVAKLSLVQNVPSVPSQTISIVQEES